MIAHYPYQTELDAEERIVIEGSTPIYRGQLLDEDGVPIAFAAISAMTLTYKNKNDSSVINTRDGQNVLNANNVTLQADLSISAATAANPVVVTTTANHNLITGDKVYITGVVGMTELNNRMFRITRITDTTFSLQGENGASHTAYDSAGTIYAGLFQWTLQVADTVIVDPSVAAGGTDEHNALFTWTFNSKVGAKNVPIEVLKSY